VKLAPELSLEALTGKREAMAEDFSRPVLDGLGQSGRIHSQM